MRAAGGSLPPIKKQSLYNAPPGGSGPKDPGGPGGPGWSSGSDDGWGDVGASLATKGQRSSPPAALIVVSAAIVPFTFWLGPINRIAAVLVGMFVGVAMLGVTRLLINSRISGGRYADWSISAAHVATALFVAGWGIGAFSMWILAIEFSRRFT